MDRDAYFAQLLAEGAEADVPEITEDNAPELYRMLEEIEDDEITCCSFPMVSEPVGVDDIPQDVMRQLCTMETIPLVIDSGDSLDDELTRFSFPVSTETVDPEFFSQEIHEKMLTAPTVPFFRAWDEESA